MSLGFSVVPRPGRAAAAVLEVGASGLHGAVPAFDLVSRNASISQQGRLCRPRAIVDVIFVTQMGLHGN
eukprot:scaffold7181_cov113-Isochrysis_galbana.AAC.2